MSNRTACILCSRNCGIEVDVEGGHLTRIRGDREHPISAGYICQKAARLDYYQNTGARLSSPLRRRPDGTFEEVSWDVAIREVASRLVALRDTHGGRSLAFYGGGGQGNHLGGAYSLPLRLALGTRYYYSALAQEKTGDAWVNGKLFGRQYCHTTEDIEHSDYVILIGTNPWQAHGIKNARDLLRELGRDPQRTLVVIDPRRTESAELADTHLQLRPGTDAFVLAAMLGVIVQEGLEARAFLTEHTVGWDAVRESFRQIPVDAFCQRAGLDPEAVRGVARGFAKARSGCVRVDLGLQQTLRSTLNSYLEKLLWLVTGHFGRPGTNTLHTWFVPLAGHSNFDARPQRGILAQLRRMAKALGVPGELTELLGGAEEPGPADTSRPWRTMVTDFPEIGAMFPPNVLPEEIDSDHPGRLRGLIVDSANPMLSGADTQAYRRAFERLELLVVVDVALTETARLAHYVLPASSQFEKWEATFFTLDFPTNGFQLRAPLLPPRPGTLPEPEIYRRLLVAMGELPERFPALAALAQLDRRFPAALLFPAALAATLAARPRLARYATVVLMETLGLTLPDGAKAAAPLWMASQLYAWQHADAVRRTGLSGRGPALGEALFDRILRSRSGSLLSTHLYEDTWKLVRHRDGRVHLAIPELLGELRELSAPTATANPDHDAEYPLVLIAGERRAYNANTIFREPAWRRNDPEGALRIHPADAERLGLADGARARCESRRGAVEVRILRCDTVREGVVTLPHGYGIASPDGTGTGTAHGRGPAVNQLTETRHRDPVAATPYHKHVPVRLIALDA